MGEIRLEDQRSQPEEPRLARNLRHCGGDSACLRRRSTRSSIVESSSRDCDVAADSSPLDLNLALAAIASTRFPFQHFTGAGATVTFTNNCQYTVWPGTLTGDQNPQLSTTGFELAPGGTNSVNIPSPWSGRFWARTGCSNNGGFTCDTGDCASGQVECNGAGCNPTRYFGGNHRCTERRTRFLRREQRGRVQCAGVHNPTRWKWRMQNSSCPNNINDVNVCPSELQVKGSDGNVIACNSACVAFNEDQYCCRGDYDTEETCPPTNYSQIFEEQCPDAYSYAYDDKSSTFTCFNGPDYAIIFCP
ncbi:hypothetical protein JHK84_027297 [Glycine max]|nr:hypothetical protein JHK84_027297 [Glycine max]